MTNKNSWDSIEVLIGDRKINPTGPVKMVFTVIVGSF